MNVIEVDELTKRYGDSVVVDRVSFTVAPGEVFGMVGPNGAGKTTTVECLEGLRTPDGGSARTLGLDPATARRELHERIGIQLQESNLPPRLAVWEALELFSSFYRRSVGADALLERLDLTAKRGSAFATLSGGQRQRLFIALALVNDPEIVFLDELTTGLDPHARHAMWDLVLSIRDRGKTVFLTTHFMEEAERLCDRVAILDGGRIVALDTPARLIRSLGRDRRLVLTLEGEPDLAAISRLPGVTSAQQRNGDLLVEGEGDALTHRLLEHLAGTGIAIHGLKSESGNLEDVFLALTGREVREEETR